MRGKLRPTAEEEFKTKGHATIIVELFRIQEGTIGSGDDKQKFSVGANPNDIVIRIGNRTVTYDVKALIRDSARIIEKAEKK